MVFLLALSPILWLIVSLGFLKMQSFKACPIALIISFAVALAWYHMPGMDAATAALEGVALACWPILLVIIAAIFTYNLTLYTKSMDIVKHMLTTVSKDRRVLALLIGWGFGAFMEGMAGFGTAIAIPASMLVALGFDPIRAIPGLPGLLTPFRQRMVPSVSLPALANLTASIRSSCRHISACSSCRSTSFARSSSSPSSAARRRPSKAFSWLPCSRPWAWLCRNSSSRFSRRSGTGCHGGFYRHHGLIVVYSHFRPIDDPEYAMDINPAHVPLRGGLLACLPFILIFVFLLLTSKLVPFIHAPLMAIESSVLIDTGQSGVPYTLIWVRPPGIHILLAAFISGKAQSARFSEMFFVLLNTIKGLRNTIITIIAVIATAKVMGYSGMTSDIARTAVEATGMMYPAIAPLIGSVGTFITGSGTSSNVLFGNLQTDAAAAINANKAWLAAANAAGTCAGKMISPQSIAIAVGAISLTGKDNEILQAIMKVYVPYIILLGAIVYFGQVLVG